MKKKKKAEHKINYGFPDLMRKMIAFTYLHTQLLVLRRTCWSLRPEMHDKTRRGSNLYLKHHTSNEQIKDGQFHEKQNAIA